MSWTRRGWWWILLHYRNLRNHVVSNHINEWIFLRMLICVVYLVEWMRLKDQWIYLSIVYQQNVISEHDAASENFFFILESSQYTQFPLNGFHCLQDSYTWLSNISGVDHARCVRDCLWSEECTMLMYNPWEDVCVLGSQTCVIAEPHNQLMTQVFRQQEDPECLLPMAVSEVNSGTRLIQVKDQTSLALLDRGGQSYLGGSNTPGSNNRGYFDFDDEHYWDTTDHVLLTLFPWCSVAWLPYTVGEPIPLRAVVGGRWNGKPVYMLKITTNSGDYEYKMYVIGHPVVNWAVALAILIQL